MKKASGAVREAGKNLVPKGKGERVVWVREGRESKTSLRELNGCGNKGQEKRLSDHGAKTVFKAMSGLEQNYGLNESVLLSTST